MAKAKSLISFAVTAKPIWVFVFAYSDCWFSHDAAQLLFFYFVMLYSEYTYRGRAVTNVERTSGPTTLLYMYETGNKVWYV